VTWALVLSVLGAESTPPDPLPKQTVVFYNARIAQRQRKPVEVLKLWLVHNGLKDDGKPGTHEPEFRSVLWASTGAMGICQDGMARDDDERGAGLWPLGLHNSVLAAKEPDDLPSPYEAYDVGRQQRLVSLADVLDEEELQSVSFSQTACLTPAFSLFENGLNPFEDLSDRLASGKLLRQLLVKSLQTVKREQVTTMAVVEARIFDLDLALTRLRSQRKETAAFDASSAVRGANMSSEAARQAGIRAATALTEPKHVAFLEHTLSWAPSEWLTLSKTRREFLFANARPHARNADELTALTFGIIDALVARNDGAEAMGWIGTLTNENDRQLVTEGARGERLLALGEASGFKERSVVALHRGTRELERGALGDALRSFAFALAHSGASKTSTPVHALARRWLSYVLSRYETSAEVLATLKALVPRQDFNPIIEDLIWAAALRADATSFDRLAATVQRGSSFDEKVNRLSLLAHGKAGELVTVLRLGANEGPYETLRFSKQLVDTLERDEAEVRRANRVLLAQLIDLLDEVAAQPGVAKMTERTARELAGRVQSLLEALGAGGGSAAATRALSLGHSAFAGSLRLAPSDPLPWPFQPPAVEAPSAFTPLQLIPVEWRNSSGDLVFGWRITE
jgi:hypothetical protein